MDVYPYATFADSNYTATAATGIFVIYASDCDSNITFSDIQDPFERMRFALAKHREYWLSLTPKVKFKREKIKKIMFCKRVFLPRTQLSLTQKMRQKRKSRLQA